MSPNTQRVTIAEACGWHSIKLVPCDGLKPAMWGCLPDYKATKYPVDLVPDYLTDLNAMHEAEKTLTPEQQARYAMTLHEMHGTPLATFWHRVICSTAAQRAEAFLRTIGKWEGLAMNLGGRPRKDLKRDDVASAVRNLPLKQAADVLGVCEKTLLTYRRELGLPVGIPRWRRTS